MSLLLFTNNASSLLASAITTIATTITVQATQGSLFPALAAGQAFEATVEDSNGNMEIMLVTARVGDNMTVQRGYENTAPFAFGSGARVELRATAGVLGGFLQKNGGDTLSGTTTNAGVIQQGTTGSIQGGEFAGGYVRGAPGETDNQFFVPSGGGAPTIGTSPVLTKANLTQQLPSGVGVMVTGMICLWSGASNAIPTGYVLCDGTNGTPDLRDRFVLGAGGALPASGGSAGTVTGITDPGTGLTIAGTSLSIDQLPSHGHDFYVSSQSAYGGGANPPYTVPMWSSAGSPAYQTNIPGSFTSGAGQPIIKATGSGNPHTHTFSGSMAHDHSYDLPPYKALCYIMKT